MEESSGSHSVPAPRISSPTALSPDTSAPILDQLPGGSVVVVTESLEGWYQILYPNAEGLLVWGYASADYLQPIQ